jgi:hypothetical protein
MLLRRVLVWLALLALLPSCNPRRAAWELGAGSFMTDMVVASAEPRGPYLDVVLSGHGLTLRSFTPVSERCRETLAPEATVDYVERGWGRFRRGDLECDAVGIGDPLISRARTGRAGNVRSATIPREQATFTLLYEDDDVILLRGRFPLARLIGWAGGGDSVAVLSNVPHCRLDGSGVASMEYRPSGRNTLALVGAQGLCRIEGLIQPPSASAEAASD